jgi:hypothetical protein
MGASRKRGLQVVVVGAILVVLATTGTLRLIYDRKIADVQANTTMWCHQEYKSVQSGLDAFMATRGLSVVRPTGRAGTNDMESPLLLFNPEFSPGNPTYVRFRTSQYFYVWDISGRIQMIYSDDKLGAPPRGCVVSDAPRELFGLTGAGIRRTPSTPDLGDLPVRFAFGWSPRTGLFVGALHGTSNGHDSTWGFDQSTPNPYTPGNPQPDVGGTFSFSVDSISPGSPWTITIYYL